jgi:hypothetical protein
LRQSNGWDFPRSTFLIVPILPFMGDILCRPKIQGSQRRSNGSITDRAKAGREYADFVA